MKARNWPFDQGIDSYTRAEGLAPIREAIAEKFIRRRASNGVPCDPEHEVVVDFGATGDLAYCGRC